MACTHYLILIVIFFLASQDLYSQNIVDIKSLYSNHVLKTNREIYKEELSRRISSLSQEININNEKTCIETLEEASLNLIYSDDIKIYLKRILLQKTNSERMERAVLETVNTFYPGIFFNEIKEVFSNTNNINNFVAAGFYLYKSGCIPDTLFNITNKRFPDWKSEYALTRFIKEIGEKSFSIETQSILDLLKQNFQQDKIVIYSIHRKNRKFPGLTIIKKPDGRFLRNSDGSLFSIQQLALSTTRLPGYLHNGDTPQGIYSLVGFYVSSTPSIGPTPALIARLPFEVNVNTYFHGLLNKSQWDIDSYRNMLPQSCQNIPELYEAYHAGKYGRRLIVMHGSADDISFYSNQDYYPLTPSKGCLTAMEIWDETSGKLIESDQLKLFNAYASVKTTNGFLVVFELDDSNNPVILEDIIQFINEAEKLTYIGK